MKSALIIHHSISFTFVVLNDLICNIDLVSNKFYKYLTPVTTMDSEGVGQQCGILSAGFFMHLSKRVSKERLPRAGVANDVEM